MLSLNPIRNISFFIFTLTAITFFGFPLFAEKILLKDGRTVEGEILSRTENEIQIQSPDGLILILQEEIDKITEDTKSEPPPKQDTMGDILDNFRKQKTDTEAETETETEISAEERTAELPPAAAAPPAIEIAHLRSGIYPGFGQFYQERYWQGAAFTTAFTGSLFWYTSNLFQSELYRQKYRNQGIDLRTAMLSNLESPNRTVMLYNLGKVIIAKEEYRHSIQELNKSFSVMLGIYLLNHLDVWLFHPTPDMSVGLTQEDDRLGFSLNVRF
jgi:hypothetical protein